MLDILTHEEFDKLAAAYALTSKRCVSDVVRTWEVSPVKAPQHYGTAAWEFDLDGAILSPLIESVSFEVVMSADSITVFPARDGAFPPATFFNFEDAQQYAREFPHASCVCPALSFEVES